MKLFRVKVCKVSLNINWEREGRWAGQFAALWYHLITKSSNSPNLKLIFWNMYFFNWVNHISQFPLNFSDYHLITYSGNSANLKLIFWNGIFFELLSKQPPRSETNKRLITVWTCNIFYVSYSPQCWLCWCSK